MRVSHDDKKGGLLERLQSLEEQKKQKVLVATTIIAMIIVIYFWLAYFNNIVGSIAEPAGTEAPAAPADQAPAQNQGVFQNIWSGMTSLGEYFNRVARGLGTVLQAPRQYIVNPPQ